MDAWREYFGLVATLLRSDDTTESNAEGGSGNLERLLREHDPDQIRVTDIDAGREAKVYCRGETTVLLFDPDNVPRAALRELGEEFRQAYERNNGVSVGEFGGIASVAKSEGTNGRLDATYLL